MNRPFAGRGWLIAPALITSLMVAGACLALERPSAQEMARYKEDGSFKERAQRARALGNHRVNPALVQRATYRLRTEQWRQGLLAEPPTPPPAWRGMPTTGTVRILALLIEFTDYTHTNTPASIDAKLYGDGTGTPPYESVRNFYRRSSYNQLEITGGTLGWYQAAYPRSSVPKTTAGREALIKEALTSFDAAGHDFSQYDNNGDGAIDYFVVIWTGPDEGWGSFWWGYQTSFSDGTFRLDGKRLRDYSWQWEATPVGGTFTPRVVIHETGHALGVPDYYDYDDTVGPQGGVGGLDQMDANWGDHNCFSKFLLGWITPTVISGGANLVTLRPSGTQTDAVLFAKGATTDPFTEYFMVQNRRRVGNDTSYPADGLLIWHLDARLNAGGTDYLYDNSYTEHKLLRLMEADGLEEIETGDQNADAGDYYVSGRTLPVTGRPSTARYDGLANPMQVVNVSAAGDPMTAHIDEVASPTPSLSIDDVSVTEGPSGTVTATFKVKLSAPSSQPVTVDYGTASPAPAPAPTPAPNAGDR